MRIKQKTISAPFNANEGIWNRDIENIFPKTPKAEEKSVALKNTQAEHTTRKVIIIWI